MSSEQIKETREQVRAKLAKLNKRENTDDVLELTLEELTAISGGVGKRGNQVRSVDIGWLSGPCVVDAGRPSGEDS